jgi:hypothetical protein
MDGRDRQNRQAASEGYNAIRQRLLIIRHVICSFQHTLFIPYPIHA